MVIFWGNSHQRGQNRIYIFLQFKTEIRNKSHYQKFSCEIAKLNGSMCIYTFKARLLVNRENVAHLQQLNIKLEPVITV